MLDKFKIGNYTDNENCTGVTVILCEEGAVAGGRRSRRGSGNQRNGFAGERTRPCKRLTPLRFREAALSVWKPLAASWNICGKKIAAMIRENSECP